MHFLDLIGTKLKNEALSDLFETHDVEVVYEYDRAREGIPDTYRAEIPSLGLEFVFDENQTLETLFVRQLEVSAFDPFSGDARVGRFGCKSEAREFALSHGIRTSEGRADFMGEERDWIRFDHDGYSIHYEYVNSILRMITLRAAGPEQR